MQLVVEATADTLAPSVDQFAVSPVSRALGGSFTISYTVSDTGGSSLNRVELQRAPDNGGSPGVWAEISEQAVSGESDSGFFTDAPPAAGTYWYGLHVVENSENRTTEDSPLQVIVDAIPDTIDLPPIVVPVAMLVPGASSEA